MNALYDINWLKKRKPFIIEIDVDKRKFIKERKDKQISECIYTFNTVIIQTGNKLRLKNNIK